MNNIVFQKDYNFYVFEHKYSNEYFNSNLFHVFKLELRNFFNIEFIEIEYPFRNDLQRFFLKTIRGLKIKSNSIKLDLYEYHICSDIDFLATKKKPLNFDFNEYENNFKFFIKNQKDKQLIEQATFIFNTNLIFITQYFGVSKEYLKKSNKDELKLFINIFNKKIKHYETS